MTKTVLLIGADFLDLVAKSSEPVEIGAVGPDHYSARDAKRIGPMVASKAAKCSLRQASAGTSCRASRHGGLVNRWLTDNPDACRREAEAMRRRAEALDDDGGDKRIDASAERKRATQKTLPGLEAEQ